MAKLRYKVLPEGMLGDIHVPIDIVYIKRSDVDAAGLTPRQAFEAIAKTSDAPMGLNIFDTETVGTTSDGVMVEGTVTHMAAADRGRFNPEFGFLEAMEMPYSEELVKEEKHLFQWQKNFPGRKMFRGPDESKKVIPVHNACVTGRACNQNCSTEMANMITMEEIMLPVLGQQEIINDGKVMVGYTGGIVSVGVGLTVPELSGRMFPTRQFKIGESAHSCGKRTKTLKEDVPCLTCTKQTLAKNIIRCILSGGIPAENMAPAPSVLTIAKHLGTEINYDNIAPAAYEELDSIGFTKEWMEKDLERLTPEEIIERADELIPGMEGAVTYNVKDIVKYMEIDV